ncbi:hypothetical protein EYF80_040191 [Liparis tanakae]|uniref:Uncharacterized protein n=1 Tax=Liparis tanakae TaxID=230148 RepID=A0A4Z2G9E0_9TELE|nr:hypothetical protein EYF80_040191 [Liparis tanakae]
MEAERRSGRSLNSGQSLNRAMALLLPASFLCLSGARAAAGALTSISGREVKSSSSSSMSSSLSVSSDTSESSSVWGGCGCVCVCVCDCICICVCVCICCCCGDSERITPRPAICTGSEAGSVCLCSGLRVPEDSVVSPPLLLLPPAAQTSSSASLLPPGRHRETSSEPDSGGLTCLSLSCSILASRFLSGGERYFWVSNFFSSSMVWSLENRT